MKWFNPAKTFFRDYIFSNLFDHYYKSNDTYQDSEGKGIFERFIDVCSGYFDTEVMPDIDNFMGLSLGILWVHTVCLWRIN